MIKLLHIGIEACSGKWLSSAFHQMTDCKEINSRGQLDINEIRDVFNNHNPDIVFLQTQANKTELLPMVEEMAQTSVVINWCGDVRDSMPEWYREFDKYCVTCFSNMRDVREIGGEYLQIGIDPEIYHSKKQEKEFDIVFMANRSMSFPLSPYRVQTVDFLRKEYGDRFKLFGNWPGADGNLMGNQDEEADIYRKSKIGISVSHYNIDRYFSDRLLRIMANGCFALSHNYSGIESDFKVGEHLETFDNFEELKQKIDRFLSIVSGGERELIAKKGCRHVHRRFTTKNMVKDVIRIYGKYKDKSINQLV